MAVIGQKSQKQTGNTRYQFYPRHQTIGSFRNDDGAGLTTAMATNFRERQKKQYYGFIEQNNKFARASRFFVHFLTVTARLRRENA